MDYKVFHNKVPIRYLVVCLGALLLLQSSVLSQGNYKPSTEQQLPVPVPENGNTDLIVPLTGEEIKCVIDKVDRTSISYHIRKKGSDTKTSIALSQVIRYYANQRWNDVFTPDASWEKARNLLLAEKINESIAAYGQLILKDSANAALLAENAYALALGGIYEAALHRLDRSWNLRSNSPYINYFTGQVLLLMGYDDVAGEIWKSSEKFRAPFWISNAAPTLLNKYKSKGRIASSMNREELLSRFKMANELAARDSYFQSIAIFQQIVDLYPGEYVPYIGYGVTLERTGALERSALTLEKAISLIGSSAENLKQKQVLEQHLVNIRSRIGSQPAGLLPGLVQVPVSDAFSPQIMGHAGGVATPTYINMNLRFGYYVRETSNVALEGGINRYDSTLYSNLGLSLYDRSGDFIYGVGMQLRGGGGTTINYFKASMGYRIMNRSRTSSLDIFLDASSALKKEYPVLIGISVGQSLYFGKRK